jgi:hypothetical protein
MRVIWGKINIGPNDIYITSNDMYLTKVTPVSESVEGHFANIAYIGKIWKLNCDP